MAEQQGNRKRKEKKFTRTMQKKLVVLFAVIILVFVGLNARIAQINAESGDQYTKNVLSQQEYSSRTIPYRRGDIVDRKGTVLASSERVYNLILDIKQMTEDTEKDYVTPTVKSLVECFELDEGELRQTIADNPDSQYIVLKKKLTQDEIKEFSERMEDEENYPDIRGVWFEKDYVRKYPYNTLAADIIGFTSNGNVGNGGLEGYYNSTLNGINGREYGYLNDELELERTVKDATDGNTLVTTIDLNIQNIVEKHIRQFNEEYRDNAREGPGSSLTAVIIMDPNTGEILAMSSTPEWDLNNPRDLTPFYTEEEIQAMDQDAQMEALNKIWRNFCISDTYEPGSTVKPFTVAAGLETGKLTGNETYVCDGKENIPNVPKPIYCVNKAGHGTLTLEGAINVSCNDALMQIGAHIGVETFTKYQGIFGFGQKTWIDLPGEANTTTMLYTQETMKPVDLATNSFGQNYNVTMVQVISAFSSIINGGYYYQPHLVQRIVDGQGATVEDIEPILLKQTVSEKTSDTLRQFLYTTIFSDIGTAQAAAVPGYTMGGKTGTAQKYPREEGNFVVSFIGYAPQDHPQVAIYTIIDEPNLEKQSTGGSRLACELSEKIMAEILPYMNIFPTEEIPQAPTDDGEPQAGETGQEGDQPDDQQAEEGQKDDGQTQSPDNQTDKKENDSQNPAGDEPNQPEGGQQGDQPQDGDPDADPNGDGTEDLNNEDMGVPYSLPPEN